MLTFLEHLVIIQRVKKFRAVVSNPKVRDRIHNSPQPATQLLAPTSYPILSSLFRLIILTVLSFSISNLNPSVSQLVSQSVRLGLEPLGDS